MRISLKVKEPFRSNNPFLVKSIISKLLVPKYNMSSRLKVPSFYIQNESSIVTSNKASIWVRIFINHCDRWLPEILRHVLLRRGSVLLLLDDSDLRCFSYEEFEVRNKTKSLVKVVVMFSWPNYQMSSLLMRTSVNI